MIQSIEIQGVAPKQATRDERSGLRWRGLRSIIEDRGAASYVAKWDEETWKKYENILTKLRKSKVAGWKILFFLVFPPNKKRCPRLGGSSHFATGELIEL